MTAYSVYHSNVDVGGDPGMTETQTFTVVTNNVPRDIVEAYELTAAERAEFDYIDWGKVDRGEESAQFIRFKGELVDLSEFEVWRNPGSPMANWDGMRSDSFFSGLIVRYVDDFERVIVGRYYS